MYWYLSLADKRVEHRVLVLDPELVPVRLVVVGARLVEVGSSPSRSRALVAAHELPPHVEADVVLGVVVVLVLAVAGHPGVRREARDVAAAQPGRQRLRRRVAVVDDVGLVVLLGPVVVDARVDVRHRRRRPGQRERLVDVLATEAVVVGQRRRVHRSGVERRLREGRVAGGLRPGVARRNYRLPRQVAVVAGERELVERVVRREVVRVEVVAAEVRVGPVAMSRSRCRTCCSPSARRGSSCSSGNRPRRRNCWCASRSEPRGRRSRCRGWCRSPRHPPWCR